MELSKHKQEIEKMQLKAKETVAKFNKKITALGNKVKTLKTKTTKLNKIIKSLQEQLKEKDSNIKSLESLLENLQKNTDSVIVPKMFVENVIDNFKDRYDVINMPNIDNLKVIARYRHSDNPRDEYSSFHSGELELSYDYVKGNNNVISVEYKADYNSTQTYENRFDPEVEFDSSLKVSPNLDYTYHRDKLIEYDEDEDEDKWCDLMNKVLDDIFCVADSFSYIVRSITNDGNCSSKD
jgi:hypothetical protein